MKKILSISHARKLKLKRYFTGKLCRNGHLSERLVSSRSCLKCLRLKSGEWAKKNRDKLNAARRLKWDKIKDEINKKKREARAEIRKKKKIPKYKKCTSCKKKLKKNEKNFRFKSKKKAILTFRPVCRVCERKIYKIYIKTERGKEIKSLADKKYKNTTKGKAAQKRYYDKYQPLLMKKSIEKRKLQRKINPHVKIRDNLAARIRLALREQNLTKRNNTSKLVGCSIPSLKKHLEKKFKPGMTWNNHGRFGWHIDHIKPCSKFDLSKKDQQLKCFNYKNLQPLWAKENIQKSNK